MHTKAFENKNNSFRKGAEENFHFWTSTATRNSAELAQKLLVTRDESLYRFEFTTLVTRD